MKRLWTAVCGILAVLSLGAAIGMAPASAMASQGFGLTGDNGQLPAVNPGYQEGNAQGDNGR